MAKSAWKFSLVKQIEIYKYFNDFRLKTEKRGTQVTHLRTNNVLINNINYMHRYFFYLGKGYIDKKFYINCIGSRAREFLKFKKPFNFTPKKKKK